MDDVIKDTRKKVEDLYQLLDVDIDIPDSNIHKVYPRLYVGKYTQDMSSFSIKRQQFRIILLGDCLKCITEQHEKCKPDVKRLLLPYQYENKPVHIDVEGIKLMGIIGLDDDNFRISSFFGKAADFIEETLQSSFNSNVLVLSRNGRSRSATIALAYLILKQGLSLEQALVQVRKNRPIWPNFGFMVQLLKLRKKLCIKKTKFKVMRQRQNPFPLRIHSMSDIIVYTKPEAKPCCVLHSYKNIPPSFVYKIVDDRERDSSLYTVCAFDRQNF